jgi:hypothetical protein
MLWSLKCDGAVRRHARSQQAHRWSDRLLSPQDIRERREFHPLLLANASQHLAKAARMIPESFWQEILPPGAPVAGGYPARFADGRILLLPVRPLPDGKRALASLIINQASFAVVDALAASLAQKLAAFAPDVVIGLPTLGLTLAAAVAEKLGHSRYVPLGNSASSGTAPICRCRSLRSPPRTSRNGCSSTHECCRCCRAGASPSSMT